MSVKRNAFTLSAVILLVLFLSLFYIDGLSSPALLDSLRYARNYNLIVISECASEDFKDFDNEKGTKTGCYMVPNYIHFLRFGLDNLSFVDAVCILSAFKNQKPERIYIHTDSTSFYGRYWGVLLETPGFKDVLTIKNVEIPDQIFGKTLSKQWRKFHGGDVTRLRILMEYGGIFLDNDSFVVRNLDELRRYEMTLGWMDGEGLANQVIIANKNARFLKLWLDSYKEYNSTLWYYNAGIKPTREILQVFPELVHRERILLANSHITRKLFMENWTDWRTHYAFHLLIRHQYILRNISSTATFPVTFDEVNINNYPVTFKDMVYDVYPMNRTSDFKLNTFNATKTNKKTNDTLVTIINNL